MRPVVSKPVLDNLEILLEHIHSPCEVYPKNNGVAPWEAGVSVVAGGAAAGQFGVAATILPGASTTLPFDIHWVNIEVLPANAVYELVFFNGATEIARVRFARTNNNEAANGVPVMMALQPAGSAITAQCANSAGNVGNVVVSVYYHQYP
jgi:hypothetical protein